MKKHTFQGNNVVSSNDHCGTFKNMILITLGDNTHEDVRMILFSFSLENYVTNQFINTHAYNITTFSQLQDVFMERYA
jgi:hypothetical protein